MNKELTLKLVRRFPVLYQDFYSSPRETAMCWGFDHDDGWFDIIWTLSLALQDELGYTPRQEKWMIFKKLFWKRWNDFIYKLSPVVHDKTKCVRGDDNVYRHVVIEKARARWPWLKNLVHFPNTGFRVSQVKEKFGGLRFYCSGNDRIFHLVSLAERAASQTCEICGKYGHLCNSGGWLKTLCKTCAEKLEYSWKDETE